MAEVLLVLVIVAILYGALGPRTPRGYQGGRQSRERKPVDEGTS